MIHTPHMSLFLEMIEPQNINQHQNFLQKTYEHEAYRLSGKTSPMLLAIACMGDVSLGLVISQAETIANLIKSKMKQEPKLQTCLFSKEFMKYDEMIYK